MPHTQAHRSCRAQSPSADFRVTYHGTVTTITPLSDACRDWLEDNVAIEPWQRFGTSIAIEPRYVDQLAEAMIGEGLVIESDDVSEKDLRAPPHIEQRPDPMDRRKNVYRLTAKGRALQAPGD